MNRVYGYGVAAGAGVVMAYGCLMLTGLATNIDARDNPDLIAERQLNQVAACEREPSLLERTVSEDGDIDLRCIDIAMEHTSDYLPDFDATRAAIEAERQEANVIFYPNERADYVMMTLVFVVISGVVAGTTEALKFYE